MPSLFDYYAKQVPEDKLGEELKEVHVEDIAAVLKDWQMIGFQLGLSYNLLTDVKTRVYNSELQRYVNIKYAHLPWTKV